jgi:hypothetical protein
MGFAMDLYMVEEFLVVLFLLAVSTATILVLRLLSFYFRKAYAGPFFGRKLVSCVLLA